jgi:hypothetical protein
VKVSELTESKNDKGSTVMANVGFQGKNTIKVRYVLTYRDGKLVAETWQIDPALKVGYLSAMPARPWQIRAPSPADLGKSSA